MLVSERKMHILHWQTTTTMKKIFLSLTLLLLMMGNVLALSGGPDLFGYTWKDSNEPGGPTFSWVDIIVSGKEVDGLADDNFRGPIPLTNSGTSYFRYYWMQIDRFWVGSNGYISFGNTFLASPFPNIPDGSDTRHNFIAGLLADLTFTGVGNPGKCYVKDEPDSLIVSYINVPFYTSSYPTWTGSNTFQIILNKIDFSITINFLSQSGTTLSGDIRTGIENLTGNIGLQPFAFTYPAANYTIRYEYPAVQTYFVTDGSTEWNTFDGSGGKFLPFPGPFDLKAKVANTGNLDIAPPFVSTAKIRNFSGIQIFTDVVNLTDTMFIFDDSIIDYVPNWTPPMLGTYSFTNVLSNVSGDLLFSNDSVVQELVTIDTSVNTMLLNYSDNVPDAPGISWVDGTGGLGVYFVPPYYPCIITATRFYIESNASGATFIGKIYDDDGENNEAGTLRDSVMFTAPIFVGGYNTITPLHPVVIYSGGVYVAWEMYGLDITLAKDITPPISRRTFECVGGAWSEYRANQAEDFLISCTINKHYIEDVGTTVIASPVSDTLTAPVNVAVWVKNLGAGVEDDFSVNYRALGQPVVSEVYLGPALNPGDSALHTFASPLVGTVGTSGQLCAWTQKNNDYDAQNDTSCRFIQVQQGSGVQEIAATSSISVFPNPAHSLSCVRFTNPDHANYSLKVYDTFGALVYSNDQITGDKVYLTREMLAPGLYVIELSGPTVMHAKLVMQ